MPPDDQKNDGFLNPKSMLTPGACGAFVMLATNGLAVAFNIQNNGGRSLIGLALSFLVGTVVFASQVANLWQKIVFYIVNSLIIFSMGTGVNSATQVAIRPATTIRPLQPSNNTRPEPGGSTKPPPQPAIEARPIVTPRVQFLQEWH
jgi:hypothetical protein